MIFIHAGWRTGSTYVWKKFRELPECLAFCEPFHENLSSATASSISELTTESWSSGHPHLPRPYQEEFLPLLTNRGIQKFSLDFVTNFYFHTFYEHENQRKYIAQFVKLAEERKSLPVFKCCRSLGRSGWFREEFPDASHLVLIRDPVQQWLSMQRLMQRLGNRYFTTMNCMILGNATEGTGCEAAEMLNIPKKHFTNYRDQYKFYDAYSSRLSDSDSFLVFFYLYLTSYMAALPYADRVIDIESLSTDCSYQKDLEAYLKLSHNINTSFSDARITYVDPNGTLEEAKGIRSKFSEECNSLLSHNDNLFLKNISNDINIATFLRTKSGLT